MLRPATPSDRAALIALALAEDAAYSGAPEVSEDEAGEFIDLFEPGVVYECDGRVAGYAAETGDKPLVLVDPAIDPAPALEALVPWLAERGHRRVDTYAGDARRIAWLSERGFSHERSTFDLHRGADPPPASPEWPRDVEVARYRRGDDDAAVHALIYVDAAWAEIAGHVSHPLEAWQAMIGPEYRGWVARRDGRPVGWVAGRVFDDGRGWIQQVAVARPERRRGLGRALLLHSLDELRSLGATSFALGVEAVNDGAVGLYLDIGFAVEREWRVYAKPAA